MQLQYSETKTVVCGNFYSETYILQLIQLYSETNVWGFVFGNWYSETNPDVFGNYCPKLVIDHVLGTNCCSQNVNVLSRGGGKFVLLVDNTMHVFARGGGNFEVLWWKYELVSESEHISLWIGVVAESSHIRCWILICSFRFPTDILRDDSWVAHQHAQEQASTTEWKVSAHNNKGPVSSRICCSRVPSRETIAS